MKYIMYEMGDGRKMPIIFPEMLTHSIMDMAFRHGIRRCLGDSATPTGAGFIAIGDNIQTFGKAESMLNLEPGPVDADRVALGDSAAYIPDEMIQGLIAKAKVALDKK